jgi:hypothetical protein
VHDRADNLVNIGCLMPAAVAASIAASTGESGARQESVHSADSEPS